MYWSVHPPLLSFAISCPKDSLCLRFEQITIQHNETSSTAPSFHQHMKSCEISIFVITRYAILFLHSCQHLLWISLSQVKEVNTLHMQEKYLHSAYYQQFSELLAETNQLGCSQEVLTLCYASAFNSYTCGLAIVYQYVAIKVILKSCVLFKKKKFF